MAERLSPLALYFMGYFTAEFQAINPDALHFKIPEKYSSYQALKLYTRFIIRKALQEIDEHYPSFLLSSIKKEYNIGDEFNSYDSFPSEEELTVLQAEISAFIDHPQYKYIALIHSKKPDTEIDSILSVSLLDARDVTAYLNGVAIKEIYSSIIARRKRIDILGD